MDWDQAVAVSLVHQNSVPSVQMHRRITAGFIGNLNLLDGALPAQYGLRTAGVVDLTTRSEYAPGGSLSMYGGSFGTLSPSFDYGGTRFTSSRGRCASHFPAPVGGVSVHGHSTLVARGRP